MDAKVVKMHILSFTDSELCSLVWIFEQLTTGDRVRTLGNKEKKLIEDIKIYNEKDKTGKVKK